MVRKEASVLGKRPVLHRMRSSEILFLAAALLWLPGAGVAVSDAQATPPPQSQSKDNSFTDRIASQLLDQIAAGLVSHNQKKMLSAFDLAKMTDGPLFKQQITSFFSHTGAIRVHFNLLQVSTEGTQGISTVNVEIEADPLEGNDLPLHKNAQLRLVAENPGGGWKLTDVQPRTFFSTTQP
jgi:hypothetical protein